MRCRPAGTCRCGTSRTRRRSPRRARRRRCPRRTAGTRDSRAVACSSSPTGCRCLRGSSAAEGTLPLRPALDRDAFGEAAAGTADEPGLQGGDPAARSGASRWGDCARSWRGNATKSTQSVLASTKFMNQKRASGISLRRRSRDFNFFQRGIRLRSLVICAMASTVPLADSQRGGDGPAGTWSRAGAETQRIDSRG